MEIRFAQVSDIPGMLELLESGGIYAQLYKTQNALALEAMR